MSTRLYDTPLWQAARARALDRDGHRCTCSRLLGGDCTGRLDVHHIRPLAEGGSNDLDNLLTCCSACHPRLEALRRHVLAERERGVRRCHHRHLYPGAREACERRLNPA